MRHAVILAGGSGTRLWPLSRRLRPKQLLRLFDGQSLLELAYARLQPLFEPQNIWIVTSADYLDLVAEALPDVPAGNRIGEPVGRDTANAIGLASHLLARRDPHGAMAVFTADHLISPQEVFEATIRAGLEAAEKFPDHLVTFGVTPDRPQTGYGYVRRGEPLAPQTWRVAEFREKPDAATAETYVRSGEYFWNSGMFAWQLPAILRALDQYLPQNAVILRDLARDWPSAAGAVEWQANFERLPKISIDYGVMEKAARAGDVLVVEMPCRWLDLGSWTAIAATQTPDAAGNVAVAANTQIVDGRNNILVAESGHLLVALGIENLIVVHSGDATLVCHRDHEQQIRALAEILKKRFGERYE